MKNVFDYNIGDSQATPVEHLSPEEFDLDAYSEYEKDLLGSCQEFIDSYSGVAVYRRMRVAEVFSEGCRDMKRSLELQLGGLQKSMEYMMDVPNFLEPWYGIGTAPSAFGMEYIWNQGQAPAMKPKFQNTEEAIRYDNMIPVKDTSVGQHILSMIEYFIEKTRGKIPLSLCDVQSPLNTAGIIIHINNLLIDTLLNPEGVSILLDRLAQLIADFTKEQLKLIKDNIVWPGHGFASSRFFKGFGCSDDNVVMLTDEAYKDLVIPSLVRVSKPFGGPVFHSCGNWSQKSETVKKIPGLKMVDGAFTQETDPDPNPAETIRDTFANTGIVVCARMVGNPDTIITTVKRLWKPGMKLIVVTYCKTPSEQQRVYDFIHHHCV
jgi:hypothetical protein